MPTNATPAIRGKSASATRCRPRCTHHTIANTAAPRVYEQEGKAAFSGVADAETRILDHIALARDEAGRRGIKLVNHSPVSALRSIGLDYVPLDTSER